MPGVAGLAVAGMWYVILALVAPVAMLRRPRSERAWRAVWRNFSIAAGMITAFIATGAALSWAIGVIDPEHTSTLATVSRIAAVGQNGPGAMLLRVVGVVGGLLLTILLSVQIAAAVHRRRKHASRHPLSRPVAAVADGVGPTAIENAFGLPRQVLGSAVEDSRLPPNPSEGPKLPKLRAAVPSHLVPISKRVHANHEDGTEPIAGGGPPVSRPMSQD